MASINSVLGRSDPEIVRQVEKTAPEVSAPKPPSKSGEIANPLMPRGVADVLPETLSTPKAGTAPSYQETQEVAEKLQDRINEIASEQHQVAIHHDEDSKGFVIEIKDPDGKVVKQFPPEKVLNLRDKMDDLSGMVIDEMI